MMLCRESESFGVLISSVFLAMRTSIVLFFFFFNYNFAPSSAVGEESSKRGVPISPPALRSIDSIGTVRFLSTLSYRCLSAPRLTPQTTTLGLLVLPPVAPDIGAYGALSSSSLKISLHETNSLRTTSTRVLPSRPSTESSR